MRSEFLSTTDAVAFTLGLTAPALAYGVIHPPSASDRESLRQWMLGVARGPVAGVALFIPAYAAVVGFSALFTIAVEVRHVLFSLVYVTAQVAFYVNRPRPYQTWRLFASYIFVTLIIGVCVSLGREVHRLLLGHTAMWESLLPVSEGLATLPLTAVNVFRSRRAFIH